MGFAASQARFLSLTARMSDNEYEAQQICQERLALNDQMNIFSDEYEEAISNKVITAQIYDGSKRYNVTLDYSVVTKSEDQGGMGMRLVTSGGRIVVPSEEEAFKQMEEYNAKNPDGEQLGINDFYISESVKDVDFLQDNLREGNFYLTSDELRNTETGEWVKKGIAEIDYTTDTYDTSDDAAAKAKYDKRMRKAESQDTVLQMRLDQLNTEHKALETEMDSLQKVIDDNVDESFKTFG